MKLEGIDPLHPSLYCVLTVAEVKGHRLRLHFDGYSECYDFWTNADSPFIFPVGWAEKNGKELQPPLGMQCIFLLWSAVFMFVDEKLQSFLLNVLMCNCSAQFATTLTTPLHLIFCPFAQ